jgi:hypothetical protein
LWADLWCSPFPEKLFSGLCPAAFDKKKKKKSRHRGSLGHLPIVEEQVSPLVAIPPDNNNNNQRNSEKKKVWPLGGDKDQKGRSQFKGVCTLLYSGSNTYP